tara:strand:+ start:586 stop:2130 length:1545 start_codon:yes stop_codon:yes gene_type:complete
MTVTAKSYNSDIIKNYLFSFLNLFLRIFLSLVAIPILSETPGILSIYTICISLGLFFQYADFGFIASGRKYASEYVTSKEYNHQLSLLGNSFSFSFIISLILSFSLLLISFYPKTIIPGLELNNQYSYIASILLITLSFSSLLQILSNYVGSIFDINLKKYYCDIVSISTALVSLLIFFIIDKTNQDWILKYYVSIKLLDLIYLITLIFLTKKTFKINLNELVVNFRLNKKLIKKNLKLSLTAIILSISAFIFYELDSLFLAQYTDLISFSFYSIAALGPYVLKTVFGLLFSPFNSIFNYIKNKRLVYKDYFNKIVIFFFPITFIGILTVTLFSEEIIYSYVGSNYSNSILPFIYLCLAWSFTFLIHPTNIYLFSMEFNNRLILCGLISPLFFWTLNFYYIRLNGIISIEIFCFNKMFSSLLILPIYIYYLLKDNMINTNVFLKLFKSLFFGSLILLIFYFPYSYFLNDEKNILGLIKNIILIGALIVLIKLIDLKVNKNQIDIKKILSKIIIR